MNCGLLSSKVWITKHGSATWKFLCKLANFSVEKQALGNNLSLEGRARDASSEIYPDTLGGKDGVKIFLERLCKVFFA